MEEYQEYKELVKVLYKEIPILTAQIRAVYRELDKKFHSGLKKNFLVLIPGENRGKRSIFIFPCCL